MLPDRNYKGLLLIYIFIYISSLSLAMAHVHGGLQRSERPSSREGQILRKVDFFLPPRFSWSPASDHAASRTRAWKLAIMNSSSTLMDRTGRCSSCFRDAKCLIFAKLHRSCNTVQFVESCFVSGKVFLFCFGGFFAKGVLSFIVRSASPCVIQPPCTYTRLYKRSLSTAKDNTNGF